MFSKGWAWFWTVLFGVVSAVVAFAAMSASGVQLGWSIVGAVAASVICGGGCAFYILDRGPSSGSDVSLDSSCDEELR